MSKLATIVAAVLALAACGPKSVFQLSADENNHYALDQALARRKLPAQPSPINTAAQPRVFAVASGGKPKSIVAYDLAADHVLWQVDADVQSRVIVGGDFIVDLEAKQLVARDQKTGAKRWSTDVDGAFVGTAADRDRAYLVWRDGERSWLASFDGASGKRLWKMDAAGKLGAPVAQSGIVYVPYLDQWLAMLDGATGEQLTRIRGIDEGISMVRATSQVVFYGSKLGVFRLDTRSAFGTRAQASYATVKVPAQLERASFGRDAYDPVQQAYSAFDRSQILYAAAPGDPKTQGPLELTGDSYAVHCFRYVFGFSRAGELRWAYANPRVELVAAEDTGTTILAVSTTGELVALDPATGAVRARKSLGTTGQVLGATFDADGWAPAGGAAASSTETLEALMSIAHDRDARFDHVKEYAVAQMAKLPGPQVTADLLSLLADTRAPHHLKAVVVELLVARKDPASVPVLAKELELHADFIAQTDNDAIGAIAKTAAGLAGVALDQKDLEALLVELRYHLDAPSTGSAELVEIIGALHAIGGGRERPTLASHLLLYHADDDLGVDAAWCKAIATAIVDGAGPADRELLNEVVVDPRTKPPLASAIREAAGTLIR